MLNEADCTAAATDSVNVGGVGASCGWDEGSGTCLQPEPEDDLETSLIVSTMSLIIALPFELLIVAVFSAVIVRPTLGRGGTDARDERCGKSRRKRILRKTHGSHLASW